jgi:two-component system phosphate regulon sensor histidine kinase PhoR
MTTQDRLEKFADLIDQEREAILRGWRSEVCKLPSAKNLDAPTLNDHVPFLLKEISAALRAGSNETISEAVMQESPPAHGLQRLKDGFDIEEVVAEYNILRGSLHDLAEQNDINILGKPFNILNRVLDRAIGTAVQTFSDERAREIKRRREEYLAFVVHDLRTPLSAISLAVTMLDLRETDSTSESWAQLFGIVTRNLSQLDRLVAKIIEENLEIQAEEGSSLERRRFDLWPLVERLGEDLQPTLIAADIRFVNVVPHNLDVYADANLVQRILQNLVGNAVKYAQGGTITVGARGSATQGVDCWVSDDGSGIPGELIGNIFEKLETDPEKDGTGLGLAIVKSFVDLHGGNVAVESQLGVGTTFRFHLPPHVV